MPEATRLETRAAIAEAVCNLLEGAVRRVDAYLPDVDPALWNTPGVLEAMRRFAIGRSHRELRLLLRDPPALAATHGPLLGLAQRLPSHLLLRDEPLDDAPAATTGFVTNDAGALLRFDAARRLGGEFLAEGGGEARRFADAFEQAFSRARPCSEFRVLGI